MTIATPEPISTSDLHEARERIEDEGAVEGRAARPATKIRISAGDGEERRPTGTVTSGVDALAAEGADQEQHQRADGEHDLRQRRQEGEDRPASARSLWRHRGELAGGGQRRLVVADELVDRGGGHVHDRRRG